MRFFGLLVLFCLTGLAFGEELGVDEVFNLNSGNQGYQRRYTTIVAAKTEDCYFIENVNQDQLINFHFMVSMRLEWLVWFSWRE